ncbi:VTT domain-containing protein [Candidatus Woesebacteria bacterium]|nr:MAG: VTT domain-containing protein [Candidatus Woesebacteria bacterium]
MSIFSSLIVLLETFSHKVPLELFTLVGSIIEEVVAPIPSPFVMALAGSLAGAQGQPLWYLGFLSLFGALGKTLGAWVLYIIADKLEDIVIVKIGKFVGVTHKEIENIGKRLNGGWRDNVFLLIARAIPVIPSAPISIACGIIKINRKTFLTSTFIGTYIRNMLYLYLGYAGLGNYKQITSGFEGVESIGQFLLFGIVALIIALSYYKRKHHEK